MHPSVSDPQVLEEFSCGHRKGGAPPSSMGKVGILSDRFFAGKMKVTCKIWSSNTSVSLDDDLNKFPREISRSFMNTFFLFFLNVCVCVSRHKNETCFIVLRSNIDLGAKIAV